MTTLPPATQPRLGSEAPGQFLGYALQTPRLLHHLLRAGKGDVVALEFVGDTSVHTELGPRLVEEAKSSTSGSNPLSNRAIPLWKTLAGWACAVDEGKLDPRNTNFVLWVAQPYHGEFAEAMSGVSTVKEGRELLDRMQLYFDSNGLRKDNTAVAAFIRRFFAIDHGKLAELLVSFALQRGSGQINDDLLRMIEHRFFVIESADVILEQLLGWIESKVLESLEKRQLAAISYDAFYVQAVAIMRRYHQSQVLISYAKEPSIEEREAELRTRRFVKQLRLIFDEDNDFDEFIEAVVCFLKARSDQTAWADRGDVQPSSFDGLVGNLRSNWRHCRQLVDLDHGAEGSRAKGVRIYLNCVRYRCRLQNLELPDHFVQGSYHALADDLIVGWHPEYRALLAAEDEEVK